MRDVVIPDALQDAMSREAQAAREKQARVILGQAELEISHSFQKAAEAYQNNPTALHLRAMNMLYEGLKEKGALMLVPSSAVESMGMGACWAPRPCVNKPLLKRKMKRPRFRHHPSGTSSRLIGLADVARKILTRTIRTGSSRKLAAAMATSHGVTKPVRTRGEIYARRYGL